MVVGGARDPRLAMDWGSIRKTWWLFFGAAGGCGWWVGCGGQPWVAAVAVPLGLRFRRGRASRRCTSLTNGAGEPVRRALQGRATYSSVADHCAGAEDSLPQRQVRLLVSYHAS